MLITAKAPVQLSLARSGGTIITARLDFWEATPNGWKAAGSNLLQQVTQALEKQQASLQPGQYTCVLTCRVEESVNGVFDFDIQVANKSVGAAHGDVNTTSDAHDSQAYKNQFILQVQ
ncbi:hypothetical protein [Caenimonas aquaedulcis]|uniref:Uncharacterized protein n=1 Tax=Caenimonas aquaedulcis TaxID=2793270 RepID=A0A931H937_9BURK|nr:hypothetical protein [Caenimonas aquaedulcis]MBG9390652.1 hypothetical protein [Caenimonas aquaedulcis]